VEFVRGGRACIDDTRIAVVDIVAMLKQGKPAEQMLLAYSSLNRDRAGTFRPVVEPAPAERVRSLRVVLADTGPIVAYLNGRDRHHAWAVGVFKQLRPPLLTCERGPA
jgi:hypothetical protein